MDEIMSRADMARRRLAISRFIQPPHMAIIDLRPQSPRVLYDSRFWQLHHMENRPHGHGAEFLAWLTIMNAPVIHFRDKTSGCIVTALRRK